MAYTIAFLSKAPPRPAGKCPLYPRHHRPQLRWPPDWKFIADSVTDMT